MNAKTTTTPPTDTIDVSGLTAKQLDLISQAFTRGTFDDKRLDYDLTHAFLTAIYTTIAAKAAQESTARVMDAINSGVMS